MYDFEKTRCSKIGNDSNNGSGNEASCKAAKGKLHVSSGNWYLTPKEEFTNPTKPKKKFPMNGI